MPIGRLSVGVPATAAAGAGGQTGYVGVFARDTSGTVWEHPYRNAEWQGWNSVWDLNPGGFGGLSAAARSDGYVGFAASNGLSGVAVLQMQANGGYALQYQGDPGVILISAPSFVAASSGYIGALIVGADGHVYELFFDGGWQWTNHGPPANNGVPTGAKAMDVSFTASPSSDYVGGLVRGDDGHIYELRYADAGPDWSWNDWSRLQGGVVKASACPAFVADDTGYRGGLVVDADGSLHELYFDGGWQWTNHRRPADNGVPTGAKAGQVSALAAEVPPPIGRYVGGLVLGTDGHVYEVHYDAGPDWPWTDWGDQNGTAAASGPCMVAAPYGYLGGFVVGSDLNLHELAYDPVGKAWYWGTEHGSP